MSPTDFNDFLRNTRPPLDYAYDPFIVTPLFNVAIVPYADNIAHAVYFYTTKYHLEHKDFTLSLELSSEGNQILAGQFWRKFDATSVFNEHNAFNFFYWRDYFLLWGKRTNTILDPSYYFGRLAP